MNSTLDLAASNDDSLYGKECRTAGWGMTKAYGHRSAVLLKAVTMNGSKSIFFFTNSVILKS